MIGIEIAATTILTHLFPPMDVKNVIMTYVTVAVVRLG